MSVIIDLQRPSLVSRTPVFCFHDITGTVDRYNELAKKLGDDRPIFGVVSPGIIGQKMPQNINDLVQLYADEIQAKQPEGPYLFIGWSFGGVIATKVANELIARKAAVKVWAIDSVAPNVTQTFSNKTFAIQLFKVAHIVSQISGVNDKFCEVFRNAFPQATNPFSAYSKTDQVTFIFELLRNLVEDESIALIETTKENFKYALSSAIMNDLNTPNEFKLFSTLSTSSSFSTDESLGWKEYFSRINSSFAFDSEIVSGDHFTILTDNEPVKTISTNIKEDAAIGIADLAYELGNFQRFMISRGVSAQLLKEQTSLLLKTLPTPIPASPNPPHNVSKMLGIYGINSPPSSPPRDSKYLSQKLQFNQ